MRWRLDIVDLATVRNLSRSQFVAAAAPEETLDVPCFAYLLTAEDATVLVDSGPDIARARRAGFAVDGEPREALQRALARRGRTGGDVSIVVHTHLHYDHAENHVELPAATVLVSERELAWARSPAADDFVLPADRLAALVPRLRSSPADRAVAPGVELVHTGGHTPGHQAVLVDTVDGPVCLAADVVPLAANVADIPPNCPDKEAVRRFLGRAKRERWRLLPGHDPAVREALAAGAEWPACTDLPTTT